MCENHNHEHNHKHNHCHCHEHDHRHCHEHDHSHVACSCSCGHNHGIEPQKNELIRLLIGALLFAVGLALSFAPLPSLLSLLVLAAAYLWLGAEVLLNAAKNIIRGRMLDENFLMSIATLGAFAIREYPEAAGVMLFYQVGEYFENRAVAKSRKQIMAAVDMRPDVVTRLSQDITAKGEVIPAEYAAVGDLLLIHPGDRIPLDGVVVDGHSSLDTSPITGESKPLGIAPGDEVLSGCLNLNGKIILQVSRPLADSMVSRILQSVEAAADSKPQIDRFITRFARIYTPIVVVLAILVAAVPPLFFHLSFAYWLKTALTFLVISCPCALVLSVPLAYFCAIGAASKQGILFKSGLAMESLKGIRAVAFDKTGTLTFGNFTVQQLLPSDDITPDELLTLAATCEAASRHPIAQSIILAADKASLSYSRSAQTEEIAGLGIKAQIGKNSVFCGNRKLMEQLGISIDSNDNSSNQTGASEIFVAKDSKFCGKIIIADTPKPDAKESIAKLKKQGLSVCMLTGDTEQAAQNIAATIGVDEVYAHLLPQDKLSCLKDIQNRLGGVMFVGDGINDAPVLAGANVGVAIGSGADAAIEVADVVIMTQNTASVPSAINIAQSANSIALQNVVFAIGIKAAIMLWGLLGHANMWLAVFADTGVAMLCLLNSVRILYKKF